ncbi:hypothetical protein HK100_003870 [Physocladia obscura]|uniref:Uncharacterized protein n=1 Tax=Physocladia obscura TaxID=109957 RepID=A0AAD5TG59_9FUNG|nr:hypothetical protein HK100_003870 [Physocladia obscura]
MTTVTSASNTYSFITINDAADPTFNQLLGINNANTIAGYFGSGATDHPNVGYILASPNYLTNIDLANFPNANQTQQIGINADGTTVGFYVDAEGNNFGFVFASGTYTTVASPETGAGTVNQLLGLNGGYAVGFFTDETGNNHGYSYDIATQAFADVTPPAAFACTSTTATSTNNNGDVVGFCDTDANTTISFFANSGSYLQLNVPGSTNTQAFGININRDVVGSFVDAEGVTHGFIATGANTATPTYQSIDHPSAVNSTILNGINDQGYIVGFYLDAGGNTNGVLATPGGTGSTSIAPGSGIATIATSSSASTVPASSTTTTTTTAASATVAKVSSVSIPTGLTSGSAMNFSLFSAAILAAISVLII